MQRFLPALFALVPSFALAAPDGDEDAILGMVLLLTSDSVTLDAGDTAAGIPLGGLNLHSIDPDEIDYASSAPVTAIIEGLTVHGVEPDEIDNRMLEELAIATPPVETREHVLLARDTTVPATATGGLVWEVTGATAREVVISRRPYKTALVLDVELVLTGVNADIAGFEAGTALVGESLTTAVVPEVPLCSRCGL